QLLAPRCQERQVFRVQGDALDRGRPSGEQAREYLCQRRGDGRVQASQDRGRDRLRGPGLWGQIQHQVHNPAAADVWAGGAAVRQDILVVAAGVLEGIGKDRQGGEVPLIVNPPGEGGDFGGPPGRIGGNGAERVAEDVADQVALKTLLGLGG